MVFSYPRVSLTAPWDISFGSPIAVSTWEGGNATFLLNIPPMPNGLLHENDVKRLEEFGSWKKKSFTHNIMSTAHIFSENEDPTHPVSVPYPETSPNSDKPNETSRQTAGLFEIHICSAAV